MKQQLDEASTEAESLQSELLESRKTIILLKQNLEDSDLAKKRFHESSNKKTNQMKEQQKIDELVKQLHTMGVQFAIQPAVAIQLNQIVDGKQYEELVKCLHALLAHANH